MAAIHWESAVDGNWNDDTKWLNGATHAKPTAADDATISVAGFYTVSLTDVEVANSLTFDQTNAQLVETNAAKLTLSGALTVKHGLVQLDASNAASGVALQGGKLVVGNDTALGTGGSRSPAARCSPTTA